MFKINPYSEYRGKDDNLNTFKLALLMTNICVFSKIVTLSIHLPFPKIFLKSYFRVVS